jgi:hypothetical protein
MYDAYDEPNNICIDKVDGGVSLYQKKSTFEIHASEEEL